MNNPQTPKEIAYYSVNEGLPHEIDNISDLIKEHAQNHTTRTLNDLKDGVQELDTFRGVIRKKDVLKLIEDYE